MDIESTRLKLLEITWNDLMDIHRLHSFPEVDEFNTLGIPKSIEDTEEVIRPSIEAQNEEGGDDPHEADQRPQARATHLPSDSGDRIRSIRPSPPSDGEFHQH